MHPLFEARSWTRSIALAVVVAISPHSPLCGEFDWPQWQGSERTAHSKETGLLKEWPSGGPAMRWTFRDAGVG